MQLRRGQITLGLLSFVAGLFSIAIGFGWNAASKSDKALEQVSDVRESVAEIRTDVKWIRETISANSQKVLGITTTTDKYNGY